MFPRFNHIAGAVFMDRKHIPSSEWNPLLDIWADEWRCAIGAKDAAAANKAKALIDGLTGAIERSNNWFKAGGPTR